VHEINHCGEHRGIGVGLDTVTEVEDVTGVTGVVGEHRPGASEGHVASGQDQRWIEVPLNHRLGADPSAETPDPAPTDESGSRDFVATLELFALHAREISEVVADDRERAASMLDDLEADWSLIEDIIRAEQPDRLFGFSQAVDLVRSGVERNRPADVSKGWKLLDDLSADYPA
jgi:hypothetical protein